MVFVLNREINGEKGGGVMRKEMVGVDQWGREYRFDVSEVREELNRMHSEICEVIEKLKERSDTEFYEEINALCDVLSEIENLKKLYF